jgi:hypothetical protein
MLERMYLTQGCCATYTHSAYSLIATAFRVHVEVIIRIYVVAY